MHSKNTVPMPHLPADPRKRLFMKLHQRQSVTRLESQLSGRMALIDCYLHQPVRVFVPQCHSFLRG